MTVETLTSRKEYSGDGVTVAFPTEFEFFSSMDLEVYSVSAAGVATLLTEGAGSSQYVVTGGEGESGTITMNTAPASGTTLLILRNTSPTQSTTYTPNDDFPAEGHEAALDRITLLTQENKSATSRSLQAPVTDINPSLVLPSALDRASKFLGFDSLGNPTAGLTIDSVLVSPFMETALSAADAEAAKELLEISEAGEIRGSITITNADYVVSPDDFGKVIRMFTLGADDRTVTLPAVSPTFFNKLFTIKKVTHSPGVIKIVAPGPSPIDDQAEFHLQHKGDFITVALLDIARYVVVARSIVPHTTEITATGTHTYLPGRQMALWQFVGGGGPGGFANSTAAGENSSAAGGGAGEEVSMLVQITSLTQDVVVGAGGTGVLGTGGTTTVTGIASANGGDSPQTSSTATSGSLRTLGGPGGAGGATPGSPLYIFRRSGANGQSSAVIGGERLSMGQGASSHWGRGGVAPVTGNGAAGQGFGSGGGGGSNNVSAGSSATGGAGAPGVLYVTEY